MSMDNIPASAEADRRKLGGGAIASLGGVAVLVIFMLQNTDDVTVEFLFWEFTWPVWLLALVAALVGALVWLGLGVLRRHRRRKGRREDRRSWSSKAADRRASSSWVMLERLEELTAIDGSIFARRWLVSAVSIDTVQHGLPGQGTERAGIREQQG
jgi:uncharacterized integral membrane protein